MSFELQILGCGSAVPTVQRFPTSQVLNIQENYFLIDCGEGAQMQMRRFGVKLQKIDHIFISHMHGDHYLGLSGYLQTLHMLGREKTIHIYGPCELEPLVLDHFKIPGAELRFKINFTPTQAIGKNCLLDRKNFTVHSFPLKHTVPTTGFLFTEKAKRKTYNKRMGDSYGVPTYWINRIKEGQDYVAENGEIVPNEKLTFPAPPSYSYAFCSDTAFIDSLPENIAPIDILYHEATFLEREKDRAKSTLHSTAQTAAKQATKCRAKKLILGHFSARYPKTEAFISEAQPHFSEEIIIAEDGLLVKA
jgi:ribonuclease Z